MTLDPDLWRYRLGLRITAGLNTAGAAALFLSGDWRTGAVCIVVGLLNVVMAINIQAHQRTRDVMRELTQALRERSGPEWTQTSRISLN